MRFQQVLDAHPAPRRLGDIRLIYDPPLLVGHATRPPRGVAPSIALLGGAGASLLALALVLRGSPRLGIPVALAALAAVLVGLGGILEQHGRRQRRFALDFSLDQLRLDFNTPALALPRTLYVPFDQIVSVDAWPVPGGRSMLTVDFKTEDGTLREVLVHNVSPREQESLDRLQRLLEGAFGLGEAPAKPDEPRRPPFDDSSFTPG
jgi:hypothetical protein